MSDDIAPSHIIAPGRLRHAYQASLNQLVASHSLPRLWAKDPSLWPSDERTPGTHASSLGWLDLPNYLRPYMSSVTACVDDAQRDGFQDVVLIAMVESRSALEAGSHGFSERRWRRG
jgi:hypothetical protein